MAMPAIVWRNPNSTQRRRVWNRVRRDALRSLYLVVESAPAQQGDWKGLPALEIIHGRPASAEASTNRVLRSGTTLSGLWNGL
jgi:hypothetical protein